MGFGILFFGYFLTFAFSVSKVYFFADLIGCVVMLIAFGKLAQYNRYYVGAVASGVVFTLFSLAAAMVLMFKVPMDGWMDTALDVAKALSACAFHVFMFLGIRGISKGAECEKLVKKAERNLVMTSVYYATAHIVLFTSPLYETVASYISLWVYVYWWICFILNLALIYHAFGLLYSPEEEEGEPKRSRFKIINFMNDKMDAFEANSNKYRRESMEMALAEAEKRRKEKEAKHPPKQSKKKKRK